MAKTTMHNFGLSKTIAEESLTKPELCCMYISLIATSIDTKFSINLATQALVRCIAGISIDDRKDSYLYNLFQK